MTKVSKMTAGLTSVSIPCPACHTPYDCSQIDSSNTIRSGYCERCQTNLVFVDKKQGRREREELRRSTRWYQSLRSIALTPIDGSFLTPSLLVGLFVFNLLVLASGFSYFFLPAIRSFDPYEIDSYYLTPVLLRINGWSSLHLAAARGDTDTVQDLVNDKANLRGKNIRGRTPMFEAAKRGRDEVVSLLLNHGIGPNEKDQRGKTVIFDSVLYGHLTTVRLLLSAGSLINIQDLKAGNSLLHVAVENGQVEVVKLLIDHHIDPNLKNKSLKAPLHQLASVEWNENTEIADLLLHAGADLEARSAMGYTPLIRAARDGNVEHVTFFIEHGAALESQTVEGSTPLSLAAYSGNTESVKVLIEHGASINTRRLDGWMPLHRAASQGHVDVVKILLQHEAEINARVWGKTPLHLAEKEQNKDVADLLRINGGVTNREIFVHIQNAYNYEQKGNCPQALAEYSQALTLVPRDPELLTRQAYCLAANGAHQEALDSINRALETYPTYFLAYQRKAHIFWKEKRWDEALTTWDQLLILKPLHARAYYERSYVHAAKAGDPVIRNRNAPKQALQDLFTSCRLGYQNGCKAYQFATGEIPV